MTVSVESAAARRGTGRGSRTAATPSRITASGARTATASRRRSGPRRSSPHSASAATHVTRNAIARSKLKNVSASSTFETGASRVYSVGRTRSTSAGGAPLTASTRPGKGERAERRTSAMSGKDVGWLRERLAQIEGQPAPASPGQVYDEELRRRVAAFQKARSLMPDGIAGEETLVRLAGAAPGSNGPSLSRARP